jgi:formyltetrahydrofolate synthetase
VNLARHIQNMFRYGVPLVVAVNAFGSDSKGEKVTMLN